MASRNRHWPAEPFCSYKYEWTWSATFIRSGRSSRGKIKGRPALGRVSGPGRGMDRIGSKTGWLNRTLRKRHELMKIQYPIIIRGRVGFWSDCGSYSHEILNARLTPVLLPIQDLRNSLYLYRLPQLEWFRLRICPGSYTAR